MSNALDSAYQVQGIFPDDMRAPINLECLSCGRSLQQVVSWPSTVEERYVHRGFNRATDMRSPGSPDQATGGL